MVSRSSCDPFYLSEHYSTLIPSSLPRKMWVQFCRRSRRLRRKWKPFSVGLLQGVAGSIACSSAVVLGMCSAHFVVSHGWFGLLDEGCVLSPLLAENYARRRCARLCMYVCVDTAVMCIADGVVGLGRLYGGARRMAHAYTHGSYA